MREPDKSIGNIELVALLYDEEAREWLRSTRVRPNLSNATA
jgi:hypothetical protein